MIRRHISFLFILTGLLIFTADWLFYGQPVGWTISLFLSVAATLVALKGGTYTFSQSTLASATLLFALLIAFAIQPGPLLFLMVMMMTAIFATTIRQGTPKDALEIISRLFSFSWRVPLRSVKDTWLFIKRLQSRSNYEVGERLGQLVRKWFLPITGTLVFSGLFAIANPLISREIEQFVNALNQILYNFRFDPVRLIFWMFTGVGAWGLLRVRAKVRVSRNSPPPNPMSQSRSALLRRCLILFNAVFVVQTLLDSIYLFAGVHLPNGMSYAEYAHRGAYPLVATALLAAGFVLVAYRPGPATRETAAVRHLVLLWLLQNVFLTVTAAWRLHIYTEIYGLTRLRVAASIWMLLVAMGLAWIGMRITAGKSNRWLVNRNLSTTFIVLYLCCFVNFEGWIAWQNVRHSREAGGSGYYLDYDYMLQLGPEALPALEWVRGRTSNPRDEKTIIALRTSLNYEMENWRSWTYRSWVLWNGGMR